MTGQEWNRVAELLARNWPHQLQPHSTLEKFREDVDGFPVDQVLAAIETMYRDGREFPPHGGHVLGRLADLHFDPPPFYEALRTIRGALHKPSNLIVEDDSEKGWHHEDVRMTWLEQQAPLVAGFVRAVGIDKLAITEGGDEARLRGKYEDFVRRARESLIYGTLAPAGLRKLERVVAGEVVEYQPHEQLVGPRKIVTDRGVQQIEQEQPAGRRIGFVEIARDGGREAA